MTGSPYGGFWRRFGALWIDILVIMPLAIPIALLSAQYRNFYFYSAVPWLLFTIWYQVYLVYRYGGTPGKLFLKLRVRKVDGSSVGWKEATLRHIVEIIITALSSSGMIYMMASISDAEFAALPRTSHLNLISAEIIEARTPFWYSWVSIASQVWMWSEFVVMLTNEKRRALHDFIAGTVVLKVP